MIPVISTLLARAREESDGVERSKGLARCAMYWALAGRERESMQTIQALREAMGRSADLELTTWIWLVEGLHALVFRQSDVSLDRFKRAHAMASCLKGKEIAALSAAWLGHVEFNFGDYRRFCPLATEALAASSKDMGAALCRLAISLGDAYLYCEDEATAKNWYARARRVAAAVGDTTSIASAAHNMASIAVRPLRLNRRLGGAWPALANVAATLSDSSRNLDEMAGISFLPHYEPWVRLQLMMADSDFQRAHELIRQNLGCWETHGPRRYFVQAQADALLCRAALGLPVEADEIEEMAEGVDLSGADPDDQALYCLSMSDMFRALGDPARSQAMLESSRQAYARHVEMTGELLEEMNGNHLSPQHWNHLYGTA